MKRRDVAATSGRRAAPRRRAAQRARAYPAGVLARVHLALITAAVCVLAALIGVLLAGGGNGDSQAAIPGNGWAGASRPGGSRVPAFTLTDQDGKAVSSTAL